MARKKLESERDTDEKYATTDLVTLAKQQGVGPLDFDKLLEKADFWPSEESVDEFITTIRQWRDEGG